MEAVPKKPAAKKPHVAKPAAKKPKAVAKEHAVKHAHEKVHHEKPAHEHKIAHVAAEVAKDEPVVAETHAKIPHGKNFYAVGRRKTAVAQALMTSGNGTIMINQLPFENYFQTAELQQIVRHPLVSIGLDKTMNVKAKIHGGGIHAQAEALRHGISRALLLVNPESRRTLKKLGFLKRDPRVKERKKPGLKRARRAPQFSKR